MSNIGNRLRADIAMIVKITDDFSINVSRKDGKCPLQDVFDYGNSLRVKGGKPEKDIDIWLRTIDTLEFIVAHEESTYSNFNSGIVPELGRNGTNGFRGLNCYSRQSGRNSEARADLLLAIKAAAAVLDKRIETLIYTAFIHKGMSDLRYQSSDNFDRLNAAIDKYMPGREEKPDNKGLYINSARYIRKGLGCESMEDWDTQDAKIREQRAKVEDKIITLLENGMVESTKHLWFLIEKQCKLVQGN
jgi:hypothetical protein